MSAWSFRKGSALESTSRLITAQSLDGQHVRGKLTVHFDRPLPADASAEILATLNRAIETIIGEELCGGTLPFSGEELVERVRKRWKGVSSRVSEIHVDALELAERKATMPSRVSPSHPPVHRSDSISTGTSGVMPKVTPDTPLKTLWPRAAHAAVEGISTERLVRLFAPALRDSSAMVLFALFQSLDPGAMDRLELFERRSSSPVAERARKQVCACLAAAFQRVLVRASVDPDVARGIAQGTYVAALAPESPTLSDVDHFFENAAPLKELVRVVAASIGAPGDADRMLAAVSAYGMTLRPDLETAAECVKRFYTAA